MAESPYERQLQGAVAALQLIVSLIAGKKIAIGVDTATWNGTSHTSATKTVAHGLGATPAFVAVTSRDNLIAYDVSARDGTNISVQGFSTPGTTISATKTFDWLAIG